MNVQGIVPQLNDLSSIKKSGESVASYLMDTRVNKK